MSENNRTQKGYKSPNRTLAKCLFQDPTQGQLACFYWSPCNRPLKIQQMSVDEAHTRMLSDFLFEKLSEDLPLPS